MKQTGKFKGREVAIIGIGRAGTAAARALTASGASITLFDSKPREELGEEAAALENLGFDLVVGDSDYPGIEAAEIIVPSPGVRPDDPVLVEARNRGVEIMGEIEVAYQLSEAPMIALTGTNGKSTTTAMCGAMLQNAFSHVWMGGNLAPGEPLPSLAMKAGEQDIIVGEISSFQLEQITTFHPKVAILTNLTPDHFDRHKDLSEYGVVKARIFENQTESDFAVVNADALEMPELNLAIAIKGRLALFAVERERVEEARSAALRMGLPESTLGAWVEDGWLTVTSDGKTERIVPISSIPVPGRHNVENALAAALASWLVGATADGIRSGLETFLPVPHRMQPVAIVNGVRYVNNSMCTNPAALVASLFSYEEPVILISGGKNKNLDFSDAGPKIAGRAKAVILIGTAADEIERAMGAGIALRRRAQTLTEAVEQATHLAEPGDVVMLAPGCASTDMFQDFMDRGEQFTEAVQHLQS